MNGTILKAVKKCSCSKLVIDRLLVMEIFQKYCNIRRRVFVITHWIRHFLLLYEILHYLILCLVPLHVLPTFTFFLKLRFIYLGTLRFSNFLKPRLSKYYGFLLRINYIASAIGYLHSVSYWPQTDSSMFRSFCKLWIQDVLTNGYWAHQGNESWWW